MVKPLSLIFRDCIDTDIYPDIWKNLWQNSDNYKKDDKRIINNDRPSVFYQYEIKFQKN